MQKMNSMEMEKEMEKLAQRIMASDGMLEMGKINKYLFNEEEKKLVKSKEARKELFQQLTFETFNYIINHPNLRAFYPRVMRERVEFNLKKCKV